MISVNFKTRASVSVSIMLLLMSSRARALEKVYELENGAVTANYFAQENIPFPFNYVPVYKIDRDGALDLYTVDAEGSVIHRFNPTLSDEFSIFPSASGERVLLMQGVPNFNPPNIDPLTKKVYSKEGDLLYEGKHRGFPRLMSDGDYLVCFTIGQIPPPQIKIPSIPDSVAVVNVKTGETIGIETSVAYAHAVSEEKGNFSIALPEYLGYFEGTPAGTKIYGEGGKLQTSLNPNFICFSQGQNLRGKILYVSSEYIVQAGYYVKDRTAVRENHEGKEVTFYNAEFRFGRDSEPGLQVYDGSGRILWEDYTGAGIGDLQIVVSDNAEYVATYKAPGRGIRVYAMNNGQILWEYDGNVGGLFFGAGLSNDGKVLAISTFDYSDRTSEIFVFGEGRLVSHLTIPEEDSFRAEGILSPSGSYLLVSRKDGATVYRLTGGE